MILDRINPDDLFPTEYIETSVLGIMPYQMKDVTKRFEAAYVATNERLILNVDMDGQFYYRNIQFSEIKAIKTTDHALEITFDYGVFTLEESEADKVKAMSEYLHSKI
ncbi:hypothetical protein [Staphylococcus delphini]|uniref:YokE-like PH domain-containing protein n=1 Tax=Staphylococcus delphini TaxID=53344 RepID=A0AAX0QY95_9STAP|nr:hypothetical protein [Staphylococcus delphini]PCF52812.1 hypothetical protein B5C07_01180 [Staphylococcus delphini]PNZ96288.1 hypothetical protein CD148_01560 [Staphylococcus delphini]RIZ53136.1 hypothetical protein CDL68_07765 [Staphylococcus delphini]VED61618.1 Uncharacterised protein [Staphylococcus delphini]